jgi:hypothetical protein
MHVKERAMAVSGKSFRDLTREEAKIVVQDIVRSSHSEEEIRRRLIEAGFDGAGAAVSTHSSGGMFMAMVMVWSPQGEIIDV